MSDKVFLKQYGELRTGTNYLRALLSLNYHNVVPLMHVLGDKHSPPVDFKTHWEYARTKSDASWHFVTLTTWAAPAQTTRPKDPQQLNHMRQLADDLTEAFTCKRLGFLISVKHPYAWTASFARYNGWIHEVDGVLQVRGQHAEDLRRACSQYNLRHQAWLELHRNSEQRSFIIRYEELLEKPGDMLIKLEHRFGLLRINQILTLVQQQAMPTHWDNYRTRLASRNFNAKPYREQTYYSLLCNDLWAVVRETIDWDIALEYGYMKDPFPL
jgi:hypothetical protein